MKLNNLVKLGFLRLPFKQKLIWIGIITIVFILCPLTVNAEPPKSSEVKAVFIYKFLKFVEWPKTLEKNEINICTIGEDEINNSMDIINSMKHEQKTINIYKKIKKEDIKNCSVIFIGKTEQKNLKEILGISVENSVLTVGHEEGFIETGGIINFLIINNRVNFEINYKVAKESGIKISSKLLRTAKRVIKE